MLKIVHFSRGRGVHTPSRGVQVESYPNSYQRQGIFASEFHTLFFSIGTDVLNSLIYLVRGKFQRQKIPVPRLGAIQPVSGKTLEPNQRQIQYQNSSAKSEANSVPKFRCQIRGKSRTKIPLPNQRQIQYQNSIAKSEANLVTKLEANKCS